MCTRAASSRLIIVYVFTRGINVRRSFSLSLLSVHLLHLLSTPSLSISWKEICGRRYVACAKKRTEAPVIRPSDIQAQARGCLGGRACLQSVWECAAFNLGYGERQREGEIRCEWGSRNIRGTNLTSAAWILVSCFEISWAADVDLFEQ